MKISSFILIFGFLTIGSVSAGLLANDQFPNKPYNPADPNSPYDYLFFDYTTTTIVNSAAQSTLTQVVNPYTSTVGQSPIGGLDHVKVLQYADKNFLPGTKKQVLKYSTTISAETYDINDHPFPDWAVFDEQDDIRLGSCAMNSVDLETFIVADFFMSNNGLYAFYERLPFGRTLTDPYHAFSSAKRVADRLPQDFHNLSIEYNSGEGTLSWFVNQVRVLFVDLIGFPSHDPDVHILLDHGGIDTVVRPNGFRFGFGCFTLLDMKDYWNSTSTYGLVRLNDGVGSPDYIDPPNFVDESSLPSNRLWGQGSVLKLKSFKVENF